MKTWKQTWTVYWLCGKGCKDPKRHGYIGCTVNMAKRIWNHRQDGRFPAFKVKVVFEGTREECLKLEGELRPRPNIGWNNCLGGYAIVGHGHKGVPKSPEQREKMRQAALRRYQKPGERERMQKIVKQAFKNIDRTSKNNAMYGRTQTEETKALISQRLKERGGYSGRLNPNYRHGGFVE